MSHNSGLETVLEIKKNAEDLQKFFSEMVTWEKDMKVREEKMLNEEDTKELPPPRNVAKEKECKEKCKDKEGKKRISSSDYKAWDKFVQDTFQDEQEKSSSSESGDEPLLPPIDRKEVEALKEEDTVKTSPGVSSDTAPKKETLDEEIKPGDKDQAFFEKELGNKFVAEGKWMDAFECYSISIKLDPRNPVYYANRALCSLKLSDFKAAEVDSTVAIQLDKSYVKAYQRRAFARKALQQYAEAKSDYQQVLELEPKNALARIEIEKIDAHLSGASKPAAKTFNPKNMFGSSTKKQDKTKQPKPGTSIESKPHEVRISPEEVVPHKTANIEEGVNIFKKTLPSDFIPVTTIKKPVHLRSKKQLKSIKVVEVDSSAGFNLVIPEQSVPIEVEVNNQAKPACDVSSAGPSVVADVVLPELPPVPQTFVQFQKSFHSVSPYPNLTYRFLKSIPPGDLSSIFGSWLDCDLLSSIIGALSSKECLDDSDFVYEFLKGLAVVERFSSIALFLSSADEAALKKCISSLETTKSTDAVHSLKAQLDLL